MHMENSTETSIVAAVYDVDGFMEETLTQYQGLVKFVLCSSEEEVIERLGNPRLIAKTLIDTREQFGRTAEGGFQSESYRNEESGGGFHADYSQDRGWDIRVGGFKLNSWYGKLLMVAAAVLVIVVVANVVAFLLPILVPIIVILLICSLFFGSRR